MWTLALLFSTACSTTTETSETDTGSTEVVDLTVSLALPARGYQVVSEPYEVPPMTEVEICSIVRVEPHGDEAMVWVGDMESLSSSGTHHMNVFIGQFSFLDAFVGEGAAMDALGTDQLQLPCSELATMEQGFPIFPSQRENQRITLPPGVSAPMPLPMVAVFSHHFVNLEWEPVRINAALNLESLDASEVEAVASMRFDAISPIELPPQSSLSVARTCIIEQEQDVALVSSHNHARGDCATMNPFDGATETIDPEPFFVNKLWDKPPILHFEPGTYTLQPGDGIHWACHYNNHSGETVIDDGTAEGEMCVLAAVTWPSAYSVEQVEEVVEQRDLSSLLSLMDEVMGPCDSVRDDLTSPWDETLGEAGGPGVCDDLEQTQSNTLD